MVEVNEYFDGKVKSFTINDNDGRKTVGVMEPGEYDFNTKSKETMTIVSGECSVYIEEYSEWEDFGRGASFDVPAQSILKIKVKQDTAYLCEYE